MRVALIPFALVRMDREKCMEHAVTCFNWHRAGYRSAEHAMWEWLFRWVGMPV